MASEKSGQLDTTYGVGGRVTMGPGVSDVVVDSAGNAYFTGATLSKVDARGMPIAGYGDGTTTGRDPVVDEGGNLYYQNVRGLEKRDLGGQRAFATGLPIGPLIQGFQAAITDLARDSAGNLFAVGYSACFTVHANAPTCVQLGTFKRDSQGNPVGSFGNNGTKFFTEFYLDYYLEPKGTFISQPFAAVDAAGNLFVAGKLYGSVAFVAKIGPDAQLVTAFASGGIWRSPSCFDISALAVDPAGAVYVGGSDCAGIAAIVKIDPQGNPAASFGTAGTASNVFNAASSGVHALLVDSEGAIYAAGSVAGICSDFAVAKLDSNGRAITSFGTNGVTTLDIGRDDATRVFLDSAGRVYVGGTSYEGCSMQPTATPSFVLFRLTA